MRALSKTVLFVKVKNGSKVEQHPVAVFADEAKAGAFAMALHTARKGGDADAIKALWPKVPVAEDGKPLEIVKFIRVDLPYAPEPVTVSEDIFADEKPAAS